MIQVSKKTNSMYLFIKIIRLLLLFLIWKYEQVRSQTSWKNGLFHFVGLEGVFRNTKGEKIVVAIVKAWKVNGHKGIHENKCNKIKTNMFIQSDYISGIPEPEYSISFKSVIKWFLHWFQESRYRRLCKSCCDNTLTPEIRAENISL